MSLHQIEQSSILKSNDIDLKGIWKWFSRSLKKKEICLCLFIPVPQGPTLRESKTLTIIIMRANSVGNIKYVLWGDSPAQVILNCIASIRNQDVAAFHESDHCFSGYTASRERETGDSGVVTDSGPGVSVSLSTLTTNSRLSVVSGSVSASVSLDNLYLGEEADSNSDQSNR